MLGFIILLILLDIASKIEVGYKEVPQEYLPDIVKRGYNPDDLDSVMEYYEQKNCGYFKLLDKEKNDD